MGHPIRHPVTEVTPLPLEAAFTMSEKLTVIFLQCGRVKVKLFSLAVEGKAPGAWEKWVQYCKSKLTQIK